MLFGRKSRTIRGREFLRPDLQALQLTDKAHHELEKTWGLGNRPEVPQPFLGSLGFDELLQNQPLL